MGVRHRGARSAGSDGGPAVEDAVESGGGVSADHQLFEDAEAFVVTELIDSVIGGSYVYPGYP